METEDLEALGGQIPVPEEDSGSAYEQESETEAHSSSPIDEPKTARYSRANSTVERGGGNSKKRGDPCSSSSLEASGSEDDESRDSSPSSQREERQRAAKDWAATFEAPNSPTEISTPIRHASGTRSKRKAPKPPSELRAKRLKSWYNNEYRELLNLEIHDAAARSIAEDQVPLEGSQIGSSIWTVKEKDIFFSALSRSGRDNVGEIASRIGSKSALEVQDYIHLLHQGMLERSHKLLDLTDVPAAIEISDECFGVLERAGDALNSRQERSEEKFEQEKWEDMWLIDQDANKRLERQQKDEASKQSLDEAFPAANFFQIRNWLELSRRIFMNPEIEEDNWETIADLGESPAIRATALEDFHSLAVSITKRLVSATLFCTMSRQRATRARTVKHAEVNTGDVEAAVRILGLQPHSEQFWKACARRCNLKVFDAEWNSFMSYQEVEKALQETKVCSQSRSAIRQRSVSRAIHSETEHEDMAESTAYPEDYVSDDVLNGCESDFTNSPSDSDNGLTEGREFSALSRKERLLQRAAAKKEAERAHEQYVEAFDQEASRGEERRLWALLRQVSPFDSKHESKDMPKQPKGMFRDELAETMNWRDHVNYRAQWVTLDKPVPRKHFEKNRERMSRRGKSRAEKVGSVRDITTEDSEEDAERDDKAISSESDEETNDEDFRCIQEHLVEEEEGPEVIDRESFHEELIESGHETDPSHRDLEDDSEDQVVHHYKAVESHEQQVGHEDENMDGSDPVEQSPISVNAALDFSRTDSEGRQGLDDRTKIKNEYESDS